MKDKLLYINTYNNKKSNGSNKAYWTKFLKEILPSNEPVTKLKMPDSFIEGMPIFNLISLKRQRGIVIYQYNPNQFNQNELNSEKYITAWISKNKIGEKFISILTIVMVPTSLNMIKGKNLIKVWMLKKRGIKKMIEEIYKDQEQNNSID